MPYQMPHQWQNKQWTHKNHLLLINYYNTFSMEKKGLFTVSKWRMELGHLFIHLAGTFSRKHFQTI